MSLFLFLVIWYISGLVGSALCLEFFYRRGGLDIEVREIIFGVLMAFMGPGCLATGLIFTLIYFVGWVSRVTKISIDTDKVVFKARRR